MIHPLPVGCPTVAGLNRDRRSSLEGAHTHTPAQVSLHTRTANFVSSRTFPNPLNAVAIATDVLEFR